MYLGRWGGYPAPPAGRCLHSGDTIGMYACRDAAEGRRRGEDQAGNAGTLVEDGERAIEALVNLDGGLGVAAMLCLGQELDEVGARVIVLSLLTTRWYLKQKTVCGSSLAGHGRYAGVGSAGGWAKRALWRGKK